MLRGIEASGSGMLAQSERISVLSNDIANTETAGFKKEDVAFASFGDQLVYELRTGAQVGGISSGAAVGKTVSSLSAGDYSQTGKTTDLAIDGNGFFAVQDVSGAVKYTRDGHFSVDGQGYLALPTGERLLGTNGLIRVGGTNFSVAADGTVTTAQGTAGTVALYAPSTAAGAVKRTDGFFNLAGASRAAGTLMQGWLEGSNADVVSSMTGLMEAARAYQSCQQAFKSSDNAEEILLSRAGQLK